MGIAHGHSKESLIAFEAKVQAAWERGELPSLLHLCGGNEDDLLSIFEEVNEQDWIFTSHRAHYHCLLKGMSEDELFENIKSDRSMFSYCANRRIYQSAILGGCCGIAVGVAMAMKESGENAHTWCFIGDGAADNGRLWEAALYATGHDLPITFVIENNDRQVDTDQLTRRGPNHPSCYIVSPKIQEYFYTPTWPHGGSGCKHQIKFQRTHPITANL